MMIDTLAISNLLAQAEPMSDSADTWIVVWQAVLIASVVGFGILGIVVGRGAISDLFAMFRDLDEAAAQQDAEASPDN